MGAYLLALTICSVAVALSPSGQAAAQAVPTATPSPPASPQRYDACGGSQELLKKYLSASPCVFVSGQASIQATYSGTNVATLVSLAAKGHSAGATVTSHAFGYPGVLINVGISPTSQLTVVLPSFSQIGSTSDGTVAGTADTEYRYKQLVYSDPKRGILAGVLATYQAPTGSPALTAPGPSYEISPLLNIALNKARSIGENLSFPVKNTPAVQGASASRAWGFNPQAVTFWRSPGGTLLALVLQYGFTSNTLYLTLNTAQLLSRNLQLQATYGGNSAPVDYVNPIEDIRGSGTTYSRSFTIGISYLMGRSELPPR